MRKNLIIQTCFSNEGRYFDKIKHIPNNVCKRVVAFSDLAIFFFVIPKIYKFLKGKNKTEKNRV